MAISCPMKGDMLWKKLVSVAGKEGAYRIRAHNNEVTPSEEELKKYTDAGTFQEKEPVEDTAREEKLIEHKENLLKTAREDISNLKQKAKRQEGKEKFATNNKINKLEKRKRNLHKDIDDLNNTVQIDKIEGYVQDDFENAEQILNSDEVSSERITEAIKIINFWSDAGNTSKEHWFFTDEEILNEEEDPEIEKFKQQFRDWGYKAERLRNKFMDVVTNLKNELIQQEFDKTYTTKVTDGLAKVGYIKGKLLTLSDNYHHVHDLFHKLNKKAGKKAEEELMDRISEVKELIDGLSPEKQKLFRQKVSNEDPRETGGITWAFTQEFFDNRDRIFHSFHEKVRNVGRSDSSESVKAKKTSAHIKKMVEEFNELSYLLNPYILLDKNHEKYQETLDEFKSIVGENHYQRYIDKLQEKADEYHEEKRQLEDMYEADGMPVQEIEEAVNEDLILKNPYYQYDLYKGNKEVAYTKKMNKDAVYSVPRNKNYYDNTYETIMENEDTKKAYLYMVDLFSELLEMLPTAEFNGFQINSVPEIQKDLFSKFAEDGSIEAVSHIMDAIKSIGTTSIKKDTEVDPVEKKVNVDGISNSQKEINDYVYRRYLEYKQKNSEEWEKMDSEQIRAMKLGFRRDIQDKISKRKEWDLGSVVKAYAGSAIAYKYKADVEDSMRAMHNAVLMGVKENIHNVKDPENHYTNFISQLNYFMDNFYGYQTRDKESQYFQKNKVVGKDNIQAKKEIEELLEKEYERYNNEEITREEFLKTYSDLNEQLESISVQRNAVTALDTMNMWVRMRGLMYNPFSGTANVGFGITSNLLLAADGRSFGLKDMRWAYGKILGSIGKTLTGSSVEVGESEKIKNVLTRLNTLQKNRYDTLKESRKKGSNKFEYFKPFVLQDKGEYVNQGTIALARFKHVKVKDANGNEVSLWDAMDKDGRIKEGIQLPKEDFIHDISIGIDKLIEIGHGNYDPKNQLEAEKKIFGRMLLVFRKWGIQGFHSRLDKGGMSEILGYEIKGRWRSYGDIFSETGRPEDMSHVDVIMFNIKQLFRKMYGKTQYEERGFSEVDAANMRANLTELYMLGINAGVIVMLKYALSKTDDDDAKFRLRLVTNLLERMETDFFLYISPAEFSKIQRDALPAFALVNDIGKLVSHVASGNFIYDDEIQGGQYHGQSKLRRESFGLIPGISVYDRIDSIGKIER